MIQKIIVSNFRNIEFAEIAFSAGINCICGDNGQGKTNLLDAIYCMAMTKSAFSLADKFCIRYDCDSFSIAVSCLMPDGLVSKFVLNADRSGKSLKRDDKPIMPLSSHLGTIPVVMVSPFDSSLVSESCDERRRFLNAVLSQMDSRYLAAMQKYNRQLQQRNRLLKEAYPDSALLDVIDESMAEVAGVIAYRRAVFTCALEEAVQSHYKALSDGREDVGIKYVSELLSGDELSEAACSARMLQLLHSSRTRDLLLKFTSTGIQRDDLLFQMNGNPIRKCGSQGQQKSFLVSLKLAQYDIMRRHFDTAPLLLLDDVFDKLDSKRIANLLQIVNARDFGQIFITDTNRARMEDIVSSISDQARYFNTVNGEFQAG